jgi:hypothetical protein
MFLEGTSTLLWILTAAPGVTARFAQNAFMPKEAGISHFFAHGVTPF